MSDNQTYTDEEIIRLWEMWSEEYWSAGFLQPTAGNVFWFKKWIEFPEKDGVDLGDNAKAIIDGVDDLLDLFYKEDK